MEEERGCGLHLVADRAFEPADVEIEFRVVDVVMLTVLGMVAEMELGFIKERQREGIERAKERGVYTGRKPRIDANQVRAMKAQGVRPADIAKRLGIARASVYRVLGTDA